MTEPHWQEFVSTLEPVFGDGRWPKPLHLLRALSFVAGDGQSPAAAARAQGTTLARLGKLMGAEDCLVDVLGLSWGDLDSGDIQRTRQMLGQLLVGRCAEMVFEDIYKEEMRTNQLDLVDLRESRSDTDYRVLNGSGRPIYRLNIKFHGSRFRRAAELVTLSPDDCFALATYKIYGALQKEAKEQLPYIFAIVGDPELGGEVVGDQLDDHVVTAAALVVRSPKASGKRDLEDSVVNYLVESDDQAYLAARARIERADWYVLSARRAQTLLREKLFERVYALRIRGFAKVFRGAELDMHFSLSQDLTPLRTFLRILKEEGQTKVAVMMTNGDL